MENYQFLRKFNTFIMHYLTGYEIKMIFTLCISKFGCGRICRYDILWLRLLFENDLSKCTTTVILKRYLEGFYFASFALISLNLGISNAHINNF